MYIETSSPRQQGDKAVLNSPQLQFSGSMCLKFYYHMYGSAIGTLNVIINGNNVFTASGDKGNKWLREAIDVSFSGNYAVREFIVSYGRCLVYCYCHDFLEQYLHDLKLCYTYYIIPTMFIPLRHYLLLITFS